MLCIGGLLSVLYADDERAVDLIAMDEVPISVEDQMRHELSLRRVADRLVHGRANVVLVGDSIVFADMSAAYMAAFRPRHGFRGYAVPGFVVNSSPWSGYTNIRATWNYATNQELADGLADTRKIRFIDPDDPNEETGSPGSAWDDYAAPCNVARLSSLQDLPGGRDLFEFGSGRFYDQIFADTDFLVEPNARIRSRVLWFDHPTATEFDVQLQTTVPANEGGSSSLFRVPVTQSVDLSMSWMELPEVVSLNGGSQDFSRETHLVVKTPEDVIEQPGSSIILGGARIWNEERDKGIQWGMAAASGAQAREHDRVPMEAWQTYIEFQQADTYILQLGVNDLFNGPVKTGAAAAEQIRLLVEKITEAHARAQANDPEIQDPLFLLISMWDSHNPGQGAYLDNTEWRLLAEAQGELALERTDIAFIDLRAMVEAENGQWWLWKDLRLRDRIHPKGPYWNESGSSWQEDPFPDGAMYFANLVWQTIEQHAVGGSGSGFPLPPCPCRESDLLEACSCIEDLTCDGFVDGADLSVLLGAWGTMPTAPAETDLNNDGAVDGRDLALLLAAWGECAD